MNMNIDYLKSVAIDRKELATNLPDMPDCSGTGLDVKTEIINRFPLVNWLLNTAYTARIRRELNEGTCTLHKNCDGKWAITTPRELWSEPPVSTENECCWQPFNFAKCGGEVELNLMCLKSCESMEDRIMSRVARFGANIPGLAGKGESVREVQRRIDRMSFGFYIANNVILGMDDVFTNILKPFHGLLQVMENPAVAVVNGTNILSAFDSVACRIALLGGSGFVFAMNPVIFQGLLNEIRRGQYGDLPVGWTRDGDTLRFRNMAFIQDRLVPVDLAAGTGEIWMLSSDAVGLYMATDIFNPADDFIVEDHSTKTYEEGCAEDCVYYYNMGAVVSSNANKLIRIVDVPISGACAASIGDLGALVNPQTLIPAV